MKFRPKIILCNDDGIWAPGLESLWRALAEADIADLYIIAPLAEKSGSAVGLTWDRPLLVKKVQWHDNTTAWAVDGTPADCIKMATKIILNCSIDFILSGINAGSNAGRNVLHSGTVGAVIEGVLRGIPGIALSCEDGKNPNFTVAQKYVKSLLEYSIAHPMPPGCFLNVNFPKSAIDEVKGFKLTRQGKGRWADDPFLHHETINGPTYFLGGNQEELNEEEDCDVSLLKQGFMTAVPIHIHELTHHALLKRRQLSFETFLLEKNSTKTLVENNPLR